MNCLADPYVLTRRPLKAWSRPVLGTPAGIRGTSKRKRVSMSGTQQTMTSAPRERLGHRFGFAAAALALAVAMLGTTLPTPLYSLYRQQFGFSELMITVIFATYAAGVIASLLLFGRLSDQIGRRRVLLPGLVLSALSAVCFLTATGVPLLLVGRVLSGLSAGIFTGSATATLIDLAPAGGRGRATLVATMANMGALGSGPLLTGVLSQWAGSPLRLTFWVDLALLVPAAIGIWAMPEPITSTRHPQLRPQALKIPKEMRSTFVRSSPGRLRRLRRPRPGDSRDSRLPRTGTRGDQPRDRGSRGVFGVRRIDRPGSWPSSSSPNARRSPRRRRADRGHGIPGPRLGRLVPGVARARGRDRRVRPRTELPRRTDGGQRSSPAAERGAVASSFFVVMYIAISLPVIGEGVLAQAIGLRAAGLIVRRPGRGAVGGGVDPGGHARSAIVLAPAAGGSVAHAGSTTMTTSQAGGARVCARLPSAVLASPDLRAGSLA